MFLGQTPQGRLWVSGRLVKSKRLQPVPVGKHQICPGGHLFEVQTRRVQPLGTESRRYLAFSVPAGKIYQVESDIGHRRQRNRLQSRSLIPGESQAIQRTLIHLVMNYLE